ncbi:MAG TPA: substrate-binding domain-containing protein [Tepidisphaeraceae bacterium]|nr:substrate-binding domain-containing protein [Tepidisphaeraceae bacterium]
MNAAAPEKLVHRRRAARISGSLLDGDRIGAQTALGLRKAMRNVAFSTPIRRATAKSDADGAKQARSFGLLVFGTSGVTAAPAFLNLLRGVSTEARDNNFEIFVNFVSDPSQIPPRVLERRVSGLLLHGERPDPSTEAVLKGLPTVWLMGNRFPPRWGDQVMPDNTLIGHMAAQHFIRHGVLSIAYLSASAPAWGHQVRQLAFQEQMADAGGTVNILRAEVGPAADLWQLDASAARKLAEEFITLSPRPSGLFVEEDRHVPAIYAVLREAGISVGPGRSVHMVSCNNEVPYLNALSPAPATLDIRAESIGRRGVERLLWRMEHRHVPERLRILVEPAMVESV